MTGLAGKDFRIARILQQRRKPAAFKFRAALDEQIGFVQHARETRTRIDKMGIFRRAGECGDID